MCPLVQTRFESLSPKCRVQLQWATAASFFCWEKAEQPRKLNSQCLVRCALWGSWQNEENDSVIFNLLRVKCETVQRFIMFCCDDWVSQSWNWLKTESPEGRDCCAIDVLVHGWKICSSQTSTKTLIYSAVHLAGYSGQTTKKIDTKINPEIHGLPQKTLRAVPRLPIAFFHACVVVCEWV